MFASAQRVCHVPGLWARVLCAKAVHGTRLLAKSTYSQRSDATRRAFPWIEALIGTSCCLLKESLQEVLAQLEMTETVGAPGGAHRLS